jgi:hypothetical protein
MARTSQDRMMGGALQDPGLVTTLLATEQAEQRDFSEEGITTRATAITLVLEEIFAQQGFPHGGIND